MTISQRILKGKKLGITIFITLFLSLFLQGLVDTNIFAPTYWKLNTWVNFLHLWLTFLSSYYLFSFLLEFGFSQFKPNTNQQNIILLIIVQILVFVWAMTTDIVFYFWYYDIKSFHETTFYEFDIPLAVAVLTIGSIFSTKNNTPNPFRQIILLQIQ